jgi:tetratricopeptide (TPR) repeat protein
LQQHQAALNSADEKAAMDGVAADIENIRLALYYAVIQTNVAAIDGAMLTLSFFHYVKGLQWEGEYLCDHVSTALRQAMDNEPANRGAIAMTLGKVLTYQGIFLIAMGRFIAARECLQSAVVYLHDSTLTLEHGMAHAFLGTVAALLSNYDEAYVLAHEALEIGQAIDNAWVQELALSVLGQIAEAQGQLRQAADVYAQLIARSRAAANQLVLGINLGHLASVSHAYGKCEEAHTLFRQSLDMLKSLHYSVGVAVVLDYLGRAYHHEGNYVEAVTQFRTSLKISREIGNTWDIVRVLSHLGHALLDAGDSVQAYACFEEVSHLSRLTETHTALLDALIGMARLLVLQGNDTQGRIIIHLVQQHPASHYMTRNRARWLLATLPDQPEPTAIDYLADPSTADLVQFARDAQHWLGTMPPSNTMQ